MVWSGRRRLRCDQWDLNLGHWVAHQPALLGSSVTGLTGAGADHDERHARHYDDEVEAKREPRWQRQGRCGEGDPGGAGTIGGEQP